MEQERNEFSNLSENAKMTRVYNHFAYVLQIVAEINGEESYPIDPDDLSNLSRKIAKRVNENQYTSQDKDVMESFSSYYDESINDQSEEIKYIYDVSCPILLANDEF